MNQIILSDDFTVMRGLVPAGAPTVVLYDRNVQDWMQQAVDPGWKTIPLDGGEELKQWEHVARIIQKLMDLQVDRSWFLIGMGGGTVCDFVGFVGSVYMRGIPFGLVPTSLLAQVDAALGGKNGIHFGPYKNIVGTTVLPGWVFCNPIVLKTLPPEEFSCGLAECIKHGAIASGPYFRFIEEEIAPYPDYKDLSLKVLEKLISWSQEIKMQIVREDLYEKGVRRALNFGHTFGHALAACVPTLSHGQAIAKGMVMAAAYSVTKGLLPAEDLQRLSGLLNSCGLDTALPCPEREIIPYMLHDKKKRNRDLKLVLLGDIGKYELVSEPVEKWLNRSRNPGVSLGKNINKNVAYWIDAAPWIELRLDMMEDLSPVGMVALRMQCMGKEKKLLLTYPVAAGRQDIPDILSEMISWGPGWVDIPLDAGADYQRQLTELARENGVQVIHSAHFWKDPTVEGVDEGLLDTLAEKAFSSGADFLKIAVYSDTPQQSDILLSWCDKQNECVETAFRITVMIMGGDALRARKHALLNGYPFVYAAPADNETTAPGQPSFQELAG